MNCDHLIAGGKRLESKYFGTLSVQQPTLLYLHEGLGCVSTWKTFPDRVTTATGLAGFSYSRAGYGGSDSIELPRPTRYMHHEAQVVLPEIIAQLELDTPILIGHSDGASIAIIHAGSNPLVPAAALVLMAPHVFTERHGIDAIRNIRRAFDEGPLRKRLKRHHGDQVDVAFRGWNDVWLGAQFKRWNIEACLPSITQPVLLIQGEDDEYGTLAQLDAIETKVSGPVTRVVIPGCGHAPHATHPDVSIEAIARFLSSELV